MRTLVDIPEEQLEDLTTICANRRLSRAEAVRQAITAFIEQNLPARDAAFGMWKGKSIYLAGETESLPEDGLAYQQKMRSEW